MHCKFSSFNGLEVTVLILYCKVIARLIQIKNKKSMNKKLYHFTQLIYNLEQFYLTNFVLPEKYFLNVNN